MDKKITNFQIKTRERDKKIVEKYNTMIAEGYMKTQALKTLAEEFDFFSTAGVYRIIKKYTSVEKSKKKPRPRG